MASDLEGWLGIRLKDMYRHQEDWLVQSVVTSVLADENPDSCIATIQNYLGPAVRGGDLVKELFVKRESVSGAGAAHPPPPVTPVPTPAPQVLRGKKHEETTGDYAGKQAAKPAQATQAAAPAATPAGKPKSKKGVPLALGDPADKLDERFRGLVINCTACGKIYDCRKATNEILAFTSSGGICTFCGEPVMDEEEEEGSDDTEGAVEGQGSADASASGAEGSSAQPSNRAAKAAARASGAPSDADAARKAAEAVVAAAAAARLVEFDRTSAQRTTVIDDQSDYYEIDSNAWLTPKEREELRRQVREAEEAEAERKRRNYITLDLVGRQVLSADPGPLSRAPVGLGQEGPSVRSLPQSQFVVRAKRDAPAELFTSDADRRITKNPTVAVQPIFQHRQPEKVPGPQAGGSSGASASAAAFAAAAAAARARAGSSSRQQQGAGSSAAASTSTRTSAAAASAAARRQNPRLQDGDPFAILLPEDPFNLGSSGAAGASGGASGQADEGPFELCPKVPHGVGPAPRALLPVRARQPRPQVLMDGMVLIRNWMDADTQADIVRTCEQLGAGPGGFITPGYSDGAVLSLRMMCLGKHWEPQIHGYQDIRELRDGAAPPPIPAHLRDLAQRACYSACEALIAAKRAQLPEFRPDVCLCNFYPPGKGRLGMHQDKDESRESLMAGSPVVSLSVGDSAEFCFSDESPEDMSTKVMLNSGDLLVFGGKARMVYHGVPRIVGNTAPQGLAAATGMRPGRLNLTFRQL